MLERADFVKMERSLTISLPRGVRGRPIKVL